MVARAPFWPFARRDQSGESVIDGSGLDAVSQAKAGIQEHVLSKLRLSIGEAARLAGVSVRQLNYWTEKGLVRALGASGRKRYDFRAIERVALTKHFLNEGYSLEEASAQAADVLQNRPLDEAQARNVLLQRLGELEQLISSLRQRLTEPAGATQLAASARSLVQLNLRALFSEQPGTRASAEQLARNLGLARDQVRAALEALVADGTLVRQGRAYRRAPVRVGALQSGSRASHSTPAD